MVEGITHLTQSGEEATVRTRHAMGPTNQALTVAQKEGTGSAKNLMWKHARHVSRPERQCLWRVVRNACG